MSSTNTTTPASNRSTADLPRRIAAAVVILVPLAVGLVGGAKLGTALGPTIATHWSVLGTPDGFSSTWLAFWITIAVVAALTLAGMLVALLATEPRAARGAYATLAILAATGMSTWLIGALATAASGSAQTAQLGWRITLVIVALAFGMAVGFILPRGQSLPSAIPAERRLTASAGERLAWSGYSSSAFFLALSLLLVAGGVVWGIIVAARTGLDVVLVGPVVLAVAGVASLTLARVHLTVDRRGIRLVSSIYGVPIFRIALDQIESASSQNLDPFQWGGWGLRYGVGRRAYITGRGPGLVVETRRGTSTAISFRQADDAAAVLLALIEREHGARAAVGG